MKTIIIYLHGFASNGNSNKGQILRDAFKDKCSVITPTLSHQPSIAINQIKLLLDEQIKNGTKIIMSGTSLGGFYADYFNKLYGIPSVLINPLVDAENIKQLIGINTNFATGEDFDFTINDYNDLVEIGKDKIEKSSFNSTQYILLAEDDDLLDYTLALDYFKEDYHIIKRFSHGGHRFDNTDAIVEAMREVLGKT